MPVRLFNPLIKPPPCIELHFPLGTAQFIFQSVPLKSTKRQTLSIPPHANLSTVYLTVAVCWEKLNKNTVHPLVCIHLTYRQRSGNVMVVRGVKHNWGCGSPQQRHVFPIRPCCERTQTAEETIRFPPSHLPFLRKSLVVAQHVVQFWNTW